VRLTADIVRPAELSDLDRAAWAELRATAPAFASPLLSPEFAQAVARVRADAAVAVLRRGGEVVGVLAHHRRSRGFARPIGAPFCDYHALISGPAPGFTAAEALAASGVSMLKYDGLLDPHDLFDAPARVEETHAIVLEGSAEAYLEGRRAASAKRFKNWRRLEHKLQRELGALRVDAAPDPSAFATLLRWKREQLRRTGRHDFLASGWAAELMGDLFERREAVLTGLMLTLWAGDRLLAGHFGVREGSVFHPWIASMDPELTAYSPGQTFLSQVVKAMPPLGLTTYDLGSGHDHYKGPFSSRRGVVAQGVALATGAAGLPAAERLAEAAARRMVGPESLARARRRLDHIAQVELSLGGRVRGVARALTGRALTGKAGDAGAEA